MIQKSIIFKCAVWGRFPEFLNSEIMDKKVVAATPILAGSNSWCIKTELEETKESNKLGTKVCNISCEKTRLNTNFSMSTDTFLPPPFSAIFEDLLLSVKVQPSKFDPPMLSKVSVTFLIKSFPVNSKEILSMDSKDSSSSWHETMSNGYQKKFIAHLYFCRIRRTVRKVPVSYKCKHILVKQKKAPK